MTARVRAIVEMRLEKSRGSSWIFPAATKSGHIEKSSLRKQHATARKEATRLLREQTGIKTLQFENFDLYSLRHTCLTRWAPHMDPWTLMRLAGHRDMATTKRYIHPEDEATRQGITQAPESTSFSAMAQKQSQLISQLLKDPAVKDLYSGPQISDQAIS